MTVKIRSFLIPFVTVCSILGSSLVVIAYGRGYRLDISKNNLRSTGLISATSEPVGAQVYVNGQLKSATNNSFNLDPGWYAVSITKEGYGSWQKQLRIQGEIVARADAYLFPTNPSLGPLTTLGVQKPILSPDGSKIAYIIPSCSARSSQKACLPAGRAGLWVYELSDGPLGRNRDPIQLSTTDTFAIENALLQWSPDSTQILALTTTNTRLYSLDKPETFQDMHLTKTKLLADWEQERTVREVQKLEAFKPPIIDIATLSAKVLSLSPDETKILYKATAAATIPEVIIPPLIGTNPTEQQRTLRPGNIYVYDSKEDKNFLILEKKEISNATFIHWFPTSRHLLLTIADKIDIMEYDRTNWVTIYAGPFEGDFIAPWSNGSRIVILTNLNPGVSSLPNLYTVNLR